MKKLLFFAAIILLLASTTGCKKTIKVTTVFVEDSIRHYFPIRQGKELSILYNIENTGEGPLIIQEIHTSCGCIIIDQDAERLIPPHGNSFLHLKYNSRKNVGEVRHTVRIYGNIAPAGIKTLNFIVNVVPDPDYTRDYEELYRQSVKGGAIGDIVDGKSRDKGYYIKGYYPEEVISPSQTERCEKKLPLINNNIFERESLKYNKGKNVSFVTVLALVILGGWLCEFCFLGYQRVLFGLFIVWDFFLYVICRG